MPRDGVAALLRKPDPWKYQMPPRWLTVQLEDHGLTRPDNLPDGVTYAEKMIRLVWEAATTGAVRFPNPDGSETVMLLRARDWLDTIQFIFDRVEGPPEQQINLSLVQDKAAELAKQYGLSAEDLLAEAARLALPRGVGDGE